MSQGFALAQRLGALALLALLAFGCASGGRPPLRAELVVDHARVVSPPLADREDATIVVRDGRIAEILTGDAAAGAGAIEATRRIDARGRSVIPGLIDAHVHLQLGAFADAASYRRWADDEGRRMLADYVRHGFTTLLSVGDYWPGIDALRTYAASPGVRAPRLLVSGPILTPPRGHGTIDFPECQALTYCRERGFARPVASADEARTIVDALAAEGVDGIKIAHDGSPIAYPTEEPMGRFAPGVLAAIVDAAHRHGLPVRVHAYPVAFTREAVEAGADDLVHGPGLIRVGGSSDGLDALLDAIVAREVGVATTLAIQGFVEDDWGVKRDLPFGRTELVPFIERSGSIRTMSEDARLFADRGIGLAFGTDIMAMRRPGVAVRLEFERLAAAGFTARERLEIATVNAARFVGRGDELGLLEPGRIADLVIVDADPLESADFLDRIDFVVEAGRVVHEHGR